MHVRHPPRIRHPCNFPKQGWPITRETGQRYGGVEGKGRRDVGKDGEREENGWNEGKGGREGGREEERERGKEREGGRKGGRERERERGREGGRMLGVDK